MYLSPLCFTWRFTSFGTFRPATVGNGDKAVENPLDEGPPNVQMPTKVPVRLTGFERTLREMRNQKHQLSVLAAADELSEQLGFRFVYSVDDQHLSDPPTERAKVTRSLADIRVELETPLLLSLGLQTQDLELQLPPNQDSRQFSLEAKPSPYDAVNGCMPVDSKRAGKKGQMPVPYWLSMFQPACDSVTDIYLTGREVQRSVRRGSNVSKFLIHLARNGPLDKSTVTRAHREQIPFAPILRAMDIPCVVLSEIIDFDSYERRFKSAIN